MQFYMDIPVIINGLIVTGVQVALIICLYLSLLVGIRFIFSRFEIKTPKMMKNVDIKVAREKTQRYLRIVVFVFLVILVAANAFLVFLRNQDLLKTVTDFLNQLSVDFWIQLGLSCVKIIAAIILAKYLNKFFSTIILQWENKAKNYENLKANDESIDLFFLASKRIIKHTLFLVVIIFSTRAISLPLVIHKYLMILLKIYLIVSIGRLFVNAATAITDSMYGLSRKYWYSEAYKDWHERLSKLLPLLQRCLEYIIYAWAGSLAILQLDFISQFASYGPVFVQIIGIFFISRVVVEVVKLLVDKFMIPPDGESDSDTQQQQTLMPVVKNLLSFVIFFIAFVLILRALKINPMPFLAGAGLLGAVVGLGAQSLINDIVSGFLILFEKSFLIGDFVEIGTAIGTVELIEIRTTRVRDPDGQLHIIRNGQINQIINYSKEYTHAVVEVGVAYDSDLDKVFDVLEEVGREMKTSDTNVLEPLRVRGLKEYGESELLVRTLTKVKPGTHLDVSFKLRRMIKQAFDNEGIEIPFPRRVLIHKGKS